MPDDQILKPRAVQPGDRVAIIAPASPFPREEFMAGVSELGRLGFEPVFDSSVFDRRRYVAGDPAARARALMAAWRDPAVAAVLTARGGYGSVELLPYLSIGALRQSPKLLVGYSDVTALLAFLTTRCGIGALHGPTVAGQLGRGPEGYDESSFVRSLTSPQALGVLPAPELEALRSGEAAGPIHGGSLTQLAASMGTPYAFDPPQGAVLFLEDVNERPYRVDRLLTQLKHAAVLRRASALVFGEMRGCDEPGGSVAVRDVLADAVRDFPGPVVWGLPAGHTAGPALTLPLGALVRVAAGPLSFVEVLDAVVRGPQQRGSSS